VATKVILSLVLDQLVVESAKIGINIIIAHGWALATDW
jgi:hypothetical protein